MYNQIQSKIDMEKPFPQEVEVELDMNLIVNKPRTNGRIVFDGNDS